MKCPHCNVWVQIDEINCAIFRHGQYKETGLQIPPHLEKKACDELIKKGLIYGCGKPFKVIPNPNYSESRTDEANVKAILQPFFAKTSAMPFPIPREAPVINAVFPESIWQN